MFLFLNGQRTFIFRNNAVYVHVVVCVCKTGTKVTVNAVHPGVVATELGRHTGLHQSKFSSSVLSEYPAYLSLSEFLTVNWLILIEKQFSVLYFLI